MADQPENLVLEHLRALRADINEVKAGNRDIRARLSSIEGYIAAMHGDHARTSATVDNLIQRIERIETRLGLVDPIH